MTTFDRDPLFDPRISDWLEADPDRAPEVVLETVTAAFPSIPQRRAWRVPWRFPFMLTPARVAVAAAIGVLLIGASLYLIGRPGQPAVGGPHGSAIPTPPASEPPLVQVIPDGRYVGAVQQVSGILDQLEQDTSFTAAERDAVIDTVLGIRGASTFQTEIDVVGSEMTLSQTVDGQRHPETWTLAPAGDDRIAATWSNGTIEFEVRGCALPGPECGYRFLTMTPAPTAVEAFVRRLVFETSGPFVRASSAPSSSPSSS